MWGGGGEGGRGSGPSPGKNKLLYVPLEIMVLTPLRSNWTPRVQLSLEGGP